MNGKAILLALLLLAVIISPFILGERNELQVEQTVNAHVIKSEPFALQADAPHEETSITGTVFVQSTERLETTLHIVANVTIAEGDWGGIEFLIPAGWQVTNVLSSYRRGAEDVAIWTNEEDGTQMLEIGRDRTHGQTLGGTGVIAFELVASAQAASFPLAISAGSSDVDGVKTMGTNVLRQSISLVHE